MRILCRLGFHRLRGTEIPYTFHCIRPGCMWFTNTGGQP